jgi:hypothetical protein
VNASVYGGAKKKVEPKKGVTAQIITMGYHHGAFLVEFRGYDVDVYGMDSDIVNKTPTKTYRDIEKTIFSQDKAPYYVKDGKKAMWDELPSEDERRRQFTTPSKFGEAILIHLSTNRSSPFKIKYNYAFIGSKIVEFSTERPIKSLYNDDMDPIATDGKTIYFLKFNRKGSISELKKFDGEGGLLPRNSQHKFISR